MNFLVELIIRPSRNIYNTKDLGETFFLYSGHEFKRIDFNDKVNNKLIYSDKKF
jgi:hypothetical protein